MKKIKCTRNLSSVRVKDTIVKLQGFNIKDKTVIVTDKIASYLLDKQGFELIEDIGMDEVQVIDLKKYNRTFKKSWLDKFKSLFSRKL